MTKRHTSIPTLLPLFMLLVACDPDAIDDTSDAPASISSEQVAGADADADADEDEPSPSTLVDDQYTQLVPLEDALLELYDDPDFQAQQVDLLHTASAEHCYEDIDGVLKSIHCADAIRAYIGGDTESLFMVELTAPGAAGECVSCVDFCRWSLNCVLQSSNNRPYNKGMGCKKWWGCDWDGQLNCVSSC